MCGDTNALQIAASNRNIDIVELLLKAKWCSQSFVDSAIQTVEELEPDQASSDQEGLETIKELLKGWKP
jgi:hypothetical protein